MQTTYMTSRLTNGRPARVNYTCNLLSFHLTATKKGGRGNGRKTFRPMNDQFTRRTGPSPARQPRPPCKATQRQASRGRRGRLPSPQAETGRTSSARPPQKSLLAPPRRHWPRGPHLRTVSARPAAVAWRCTRHCSARQSSRGGYLLAGPVCALKRYENEMCKKENPLCHLTAPCAPFGCNGIHRPAAGADREQVAGVDGADGAHGSTKRRVQHGCGLAVGGVVVIAVPLGLI
ncbi:hypothetical protein DFJ73DRAFT_58913 [Zopfochytrium polystomum]|nr:hypothetical protein DFJ73DRAFT_58913 [Zopfochytrium polystomum]